MTTATPTLPSTYKAAVYESYGPVADVIQVRNVATEPLPTPTHVRIQVHSAALNPIDYKLAEGLGRMFTGGSPSADAPYRVGFDVAGRVVEVGADVSPDDLQIGDVVMAMTATVRVGTLAEYVCVDAQFVVRKPSILSVNEAAGVPLVSLTSYQALVEHAKIQRNERVLVLGGSSSVGMFAIQYAKAIGAAHVATTARAAKAELLQSLGADLVIDHTTKSWHDVLGAHSVDVVYDCGVEPQAWDTHAQDILKKETGRFVTLVGRGPTPSESKFGATRSAVFARAHGPHLRAVADLLERGEIKTPVVDSVFALDDIPAAFARVKSGRAVGKVVVTVISSAAP